MAKHKNSIGNVRGPGVYVGPKGHPTVVPQDDSEIGEETVAVAVSEEVPQHNADIVSLEERRFHPANQPDKVDYFVFTPKEAVTGG